MPRTNLVNALDTVLADAVAAGALELLVTGAARVPAAPFYVVVNPFSFTEREYMLCTAVTPSSGDARTLTVTRNEDGSVGDVAHFAGDLVRFVTVAQHISELWDAVELTASERVRWLTPYQAQGNTYEKNDMVLDIDWTMIANQTTDERAAPQPQGVAKFIYEGPVATDNPVVSQIVHGQKYTFAKAGYLISYRAYTVTGNVYSIFFQFNGGALNELATFTADVTGWTTFPLSGHIFGVGTVIELVSVVQEPDPTPTTFNGNWNYVTPNNETVPLAGEISQSTRLISELWVSKTDNDAGDRGAALLALIPGDIIDGVGVKWSIQSVVDAGTYVAYQVAPAVQGSPAGVSEFKFETTTPTPITHLANLDWWLTQPPNIAVKGLFSTTGLANVVENDTAYGIDLEVQDASVSTHWDVVAFSG